MGGAGTQSGLCWHVVVAVGGAGTQSSLCWHIVVAAGTDLDVEVVDVVEVVEVVRMFVLESSDEEAAEEAALEATYLWCSA